MTDEIKQAIPTAGTWQCNTCGKSEGVKNGVCPVCGPTQTTPVDNEAKAIAGALG